MNPDERICTACRFGVCSQHQPNLRHVGAELDAKYAAERRLEALERLARAALQLRDVEEHAAAFTTPKWREASIEYDAALAAVREAP